MDALHRRNIGVICDWTPANFPKDDFGLYSFDGTHLYDQDPRLRDHPDWHSAIFNYGRREVGNFLLGSALHSLENYHVDAMRVDAVASMLYRDYSRKEGEWLPDRLGGRGDLEAVELLKRFNTEVLAVSPARSPWRRNQPPGRRSAAPSIWAVSASPSNGTWAGCMTRFAISPGIPCHRKFHHSDLTFGMLYAYTENFILPLSHDEVVHGKGSLYGRRFAGDPWQKPANLRLLYTYLYTFPGKKLLFMGGEFGQQGEWDCGGQLEWHLLDKPEHHGIKDAFAALNRVYRSEPSLYRLNRDRQGSAGWISPTRPAA